MVGKLFKKYFLNNWVYFSFLFLIKVFWNGPKVLNSIPSILTFLSTIICCSFFFFFFFRFFNNYLEIKCDYINCDWTILWSIPFILLCPITPFFRQDPTIYRFSYQNKLINFFIILWNWLNLYYLPFAGVLQFSYASNSIWLFPPFTFAGTRCFFFVIRFSILSSPFLNPGKAKPSFTLFAFSPF